jgi:hypothetical protein
VSSDWLEYSALVDPQCKHGVVPRISDEADKRPDVTHFGCASVAEIGSLQANKKHSFHNWRGKERREALSISGAEPKGRGSEHGAVLGYVPRRAAQAGLTEGADRSARLRRETNVRKEDKPKAVPHLLVTQRIWFCLGVLVGMSEVVRARQCVWWEGA